ncbi:MAG: methylated-DNA--[protein]-cysteine S-methyltransferase [Ignavibacteriales bacterium]|nr:MAG: methylated-DNA--[protein]-cysteine S-methyltransferase [Ignavibacteriales bacterium]
MNYKTFYKSPIGLIEIGGTENSITSLFFIDEEFNPDVKSNPYIEKYVEQLDEYFKGKRKIFGLNIQPEGTDFQKRVWDELLKIPYGETRSYMEITKILGDQKAIRAVANANGQNKISIIIPCHRVIGSDGSLTGYGGGLWRKKWLLEHEQKFSNTEMQLELTL